MLLIVVLLILVALAFDYINGFHDAANSIATVVSTRVLTPGKAVIWAAFFNFVAAFGFGTAVAKTIGSGMVDIHIVTFAVVFAGLLALALGLQLVLALARGGGPAAWTAPYASGFERVNEYLTGVPVVNGLGLRAFLDRFAELSPRCRCTPPRTRRACSSSCT